MGAVRDPQSVLAENIALSRVEASLYDKNHFEIFHPFEQGRLRRHLSRYHAARDVLDVGAGTGNVVSKTSAQRRVALDLSPEMLLGMRDKDPAVFLVAGVGEHLPFRDQSFDLVVTYSVMHHLCDLTVLGEMRRVTRAGGTVLVDHEEAFQEHGLRGLVYSLMRMSMRGAAAAWYWRRPSARPFLVYRHVHWPHSVELGPIDFNLTDGGKPDAAEIETYLRGLGLRVRRRHYLLAPLPMITIGQFVADALCRRLRIGHFAIEATR
jgi:SAM-dependent methyltransferase